VKIGFVVYAKDSYETCQASVRLRVYDVMKYFKNNTSIIVEFYDPNVVYDIVIFQKCFQNEHINLAKALKSIGTKIVFDINVNYVYLKGLAKEYVRETQRNNVLSMLKVSDAVITSSKKLNSLYSKHHDNVTTIEESIDSKFFEYNKEHKNDFPINLLYCGYGVKADQVLIIKDVLDELSSNGYKFSLVYVCDRDPKILRYPYKFYPYDYNNLPNLLMKGDIKIAPRNLTDSYNWGHAFTKIGYPMSVGIPVVASPVPAYLDRNAIICEEDQEWYTALERLINSAEARECQGYLGKETAKQFSMDVIGYKYLKFFKEFGYVQENVSSL